MKCSLFWRHPWKALKDQSSGLTPSFICGHRTNQRWRKRVQELLAPRIHFCRGFIHLEVFRSLCLWFRRKKRPELFPSSSGFTVLLKMKNHTVFNQSSFWNRLNPNQTRIFFVSGTLPPANLELCRIENDHLNHNLLWGLGRQQGKETLNVSFFPTLPHFTPFSQMQGRSWDAGHIPALKPGHQVAKFPLCCTF